MSGASRLACLKRNSCFASAAASIFMQTPRTNLFLTFSNYPPTHTRRIESTLILEDPFSDEEIEGFIGLYNEMVERLPNKDVNSTPTKLKPLEENLEERISAAVNLDRDGNVEDGLGEEEKEEQRRTKEAKSRATVLEMIGDIRHADEKPPENVLFICKLNPVTDDDDLELIFSRFDQDCKADIMRDPDNGDSLNYGFIEFNSKEAATEAYLKMNNALIDDRRVKVDFSQSVAKLWKTRKNPGLNRMGANSGGDRGRGGGGNNDDKRGTNGRGDGETRKGPLMLGGFKPKATPTEMTWVPPPGRGSDDRKRMRSRSSHSDDGNSSDGDSDSGSGSGSSSNGNGSRISSCSSSSDDSDCSSIDLKKKKKRKKHKNDKKSKKEKKKKASKKSKKKDKKEKKKKEKERKRHKVAKR